MGDAGLGLSFTSQKRSPLSYGKWFLRSGRPKARMRNPNASKNGISLMSTPIASSGDMEVKARKASSWPCSVTNWALRSTRMEEPIYLKVRRSTHRRLQPARPLTRKSGCMRRSVLRLTRLVKSRRRSSYLKRTHKRGTIAFAIDSCRLPSRNIQIFLGESLTPLPKQTIRKLYDIIHQGWTPHHTRRVKASGPAKKPDLTSPAAMPDRSAAHPATPPKARTAASDTNQAASSVHRTQPELAKLAGPQDEPAIEPDKPTYEALHRSIEILKVDNLLIEVDRHIQAGQWKHATAQRLAAERIF